MSDMSRRTLLVGAVATAATVALRRLAPVSPVDATADSDQDIFDRLSAALTGIDQAKLVPGVDPFELNAVYFQKAQHTDSDTLAKILNAYRKTPTDATISDVILKPGTDTCYLARSIMLAWYLGAWYDPKTLRAAAPGTRTTSAPRYSTEILVQCDIISPTAYTQGWIWRVAQAHPMGYSNLQFGYWSQEPPTRDAFIHA